MNHAVKALAATLILAILSVGAYAVYLSHVYITVTYTMGDQPISQAEIQLTDALPFAVQTHAIKLAKRPEKGLSR